MHLLTAQWGQASIALHGVPKEVTYEETTEALENCFGDQHLAKAYCSQLKTRIQSAGVSLQESAITIEQSAHCIYPALPKDH